MENEKNVKSQKSTESGSSVGYATFMHAWLNYETMEFAYIYKREDIVRMCSPDDFEEAEKRGDGKVFKVKVQVV